MQNKETKDLIKKAKRQDADAFMELMQFYMKDLYRAALAILMNDEDAADAIQDTILTCWEKLNMLKEKKYFKSWMTRILINKCYDIRRKELRVVNLEACEEPIAEDDYNLEHKEALSCLNEKYQSVMILFYNEVIDHSKPYLYVPLAMEQRMYAGCYEWIKDELKNVDIPYIEMVNSADELTAKNLNDFGVIFIGGGNTFKLLRELKISGAFEKIKEYLNGEGVVFGGSAGAIIFGKDLEACRLDDTNEVNLSDIDGFDVLNGTSLLCHYTNQTAEKDEESRQYLLEVSKHRKVMALPEEVTLFVNGEDMEVIGNRPYFFFENGAILKQNEE